MLAFVYHALVCFRSTFTRRRSWLLFCAVVVSFLAAPEMIEVTSMCRFWQGNEAIYHRFLHFFRSKAYSFEALFAAWRISCGVKRSPFRSPGGLCC
ncbi:MAG: hypothetical protein KDJ31_02155 [Candidatus Competibacteraceae bacterium]|mgnify:CR=1 FL=1|nr:hypothetical protein [Candidatus Competibacteraceae bacterium]MCB1922075.1 hypothetical protein [Candidatus Competibacteraceae bacterium]